MTVRFPSGCAVLYNTAGFVDRKSEYTDLYADEGGRWIAQVPNTCIIESTSDCRVYDPMREEPEKLSREIAYLWCEVRELRKAIQKEA